MGDLIGISRPINFSERRNCARWRLCQEGRLVWGDSCRYFRYPKYKDFWISQCFPGFSCCDNGSIQFFCKIQYGYRDLFNLTSITNINILYSCLIIEPEQGRACLATDCLYSLQWRTVWFCELRRWQFKSQIISHVSPFVMEFEIFQILGFLIEFQKLVLTRCFCLKAILSSGFSSETL